MFYDKHTNIVEWGCRAVTHGENGLTPRPGASHVVQDQEEVLDFLASSSTHVLRPEVVRIDTHGAAVFLAGEDVYKVKRAVKFPFMDYSTLEKRREACEAEVRINRVTAPKLYLGVIPVVRRAATLFLGGAGEIVEWVVHMRRFDERQTCDCIADRGELTPLLIEQMADAVVHSQMHAMVHQGIDFTAGLRGVIDGNHGGLDESPELFPPARVDELTSRSRAALERVEPLIANRSGIGFVRRCHGDLHLRNIVVLGGVPTLFDALEFDESLATIDVLYDVAFLLMDLIERDLRVEANHLFNRYLVAWRDVRQLEGLAALPLFVSVRAAIRAKVVAASLAHFAGADRRGPIGAAERYFALAEKVIAPAEVRLVAIGGFSGTGKSTIAARLASDVGCTPGAVHLRSDVERKQLFNAGEYDRLPQEAYDPGSSLTVYGVLRQKAEVAIRAGYSVIVDAVHQRDEERDALRLMAERLGVPFTGLWLNAPLSALVSRVGEREHDASDAQAATVALQVGRGTGTIDWHHIDASGDKAAVIDRARLALLGAA